MSRAVTGLMMGMLVTVVLGIGASVALAHGGGPMVRGGTPGYGTGHMGMMSKPGAAGHHMGDIGHMGMGPGMMGMMYGGPTMGGRGMGRIDMLDLTKEQRASIHRLQHQLHKTNWETMGKIMDESSKLHELFAVDKPNSKEIGAVYGSIFDLRRQMIEAGIDARNRIDAVLTDEQRAQLKQIQHGHYGHHEMRHGHGMGG